MVAGRVTEVVALRRYLLYKFGPSTVNAVAIRRWSQMRGSQMGGSIVLENNDTH